MSVWTEDLTDAQLKMLMQSTVECYGVQLFRADWKVARNLMALGLGSIEGDPGAELGGMFFANDEGVRILREFEPEDDDEDVIDAFFYEQSLRGAR